MGLETKNYFAGEGHQQLKQPDVSDSIQTVTVSDSQWMKSHGSETASWSNGLSVRESSVGEEATTEAEDIVGNRYQSMTREDYDRLRQPVP
jgi:hypothetical protein